MRWAALAAVLFNVTFSSFSSSLCYLWGGKGIGETSNEYPTYFTPMGYAFSIWGLIYLAQIMYSVFQLLPSQSEYTVYDKVAGVLFLSQILTSAWVVVFTSDYMFYAEILIILTYLCTADMYFQIKSFLQVEKKDSSNWWSILSVPFGLYFGWMTVATIAGVGITIESCTGNYTSPLLGIYAQSWAEGLIAIATGLGIYISSRYRDVVYPAVIAWATTAIYLKTAHTTEGVHTTAEVSSLISAAWIVYQAFALWKKSTPATKVDSAASADEQL